MFLQARAPSCPIISVGTHVDRYPSKRGSRTKVVTDALAALTRNFPDITFTFAVVDGRPKSTDGIEELKQLIYNHATTMTYFKGSHRDLMIGREVSASVLLFCPCNLLETSFTINSAFGGKILKTESCANTHTFHTIY